MQITENTALLVIDVQQGIENPAHGKRSNPQAEANMARLIATWRSQHWPIVHVRHDSVEPHSLLRPELPGNAFKPEALPLTGEKVFGKSVNSAFIGTGLTEYLNQLQIRSLVIIGLTIDHCVSASTRMAADLGYSVTVISDATAAFGRKGFDGVFYDAETIHAVNLVSLQDEFCKVCTTQFLLDALSLGS